MRRSSLSSPKTSVPAPGSMAMRALGAEMAKQMVAAGIGVSVLPDFSVAGDPLLDAGLIAVVPLPEAEERVTMVALHAPAGPGRPGLPEGVAELLGHLVRRARRLELEAAAARDRPA